MNTPTDIQPAVFWRRATARAIDAVCMLVLCGLAAMAASIVLLIFIVAGEVDLFGNNEGPLAELLIVGMVLLALVLTYLYEVTSTARWGQTFGKRLMDLCVIRCLDTENVAVEPPRRHSSMMRWAIPHGAAVAATILSGVAVMAIGDEGLTDGEFLRLLVPFCVFVAVVWSMCYVSALFDSQRQGWHDKAAGTIVIYATNEVLERL